MLRLTSTCTCVLYVYTQVREFPVVSAVGFERLWVIKECESSAKPVVG